MLRTALVALALVLSPALITQPASMARFATPHASAQTIEPFDINTASLEQLDSLPGIGPSKAAAIIAARERRPFRRLTDLLRVPGIGRSTLTRLAPYLRFDPPARIAPSR